MHPADAERFYARHAWWYDATRSLTLPWRRRALKRLDVREGERVIDFGCGTGKNFSFLARRGARITGVDGSEAMLQRARRKFPSAELVRADITQFRVRETAGKAVCTYALSMVEDWETALENMARAISPGGTLVLLDFHPLLGPLRFLNGPFRRWLHWYGVDHERPVADRLRRHFEDVREEIPRWGYVHILSGRRTSSSWSSA